MENNQVFLTKIRNKVASLEFLELREALKEAYNAGITGYEMIEYGILEGIKCSGDIGLMIAAEALSKELPQLTKRATKQNKNNIQNSSQKVVIGTVQGDIHDFGKNILIVCWNLVELILKTWELMYLQKDFYHGPSFLKLK